MRVVLVSHFYPPERNAGTENYTLGLARGLSRIGHDVVVVCATGWDTGARHVNGTITEDGDVPVRRLHLNWTKAPSGNRVLFDSDVVEQWFGRELDRIEPDVVHVTSAMTLGVGVLRAVRARDIPLVLTLMDFWFLCARTTLRTGTGELCDGRTTVWQCQECLLQSSRLYRRTRRLLPGRVGRVVWTELSQSPELSRLRGLRGLALDIDHRRRALLDALELPDVVLSHSRFVRDTFSRAGVTTSVRHLANGHDLGWLDGYRGKTSSSTVRIGFAGQITEVKGVDLLLEAFHRAGLERRARLDIWGDLGQDPEYAARLRQWLDGRHEIAFRGPFGRAQIADVLSEIDVMVVPSRWYENAPLVIQEAFAAKTPVVATALGGMVEAVTDGVNGLLFTPDDPTSLATQLRRVVEDQPLLESLRAGIPDVKSIDQEVAELERVYADLQRRPEPA